MGKGSFLLEDSGKNYLAFWGASQGRFHFPPEVKKAPFSLAEKRSSTCTVSKILLDIGDLLLALFDPKYFKGFCFLK